MSHQFYPSVNHSAHHSYVPSYSHRRGYRRRNGYSTNHFSQMPMQGGVMMPYGQAPTMNGMAQPYYGMAQPMAQVGQVPMYYPNNYTFGSRLRDFFGLAPKTFKYKSNRGTWGFMGYSRRQRYIDPRTGTEVTRDGRYVFRV